MLPPSRASTGCSAKGLIHTWVEGRLANPMVMPAVNPAIRMTCSENSQDRIQPMSALRKDYTAHDRFMSVFELLKQAKFVCARNMRTMRTELAEPRNVPCADDQYSG